MKYLATLDPHGWELCQSFATEKEAQDWLDSQNNNAEKMTVIDWFDDNGQFVDGYIYTQG